MKKIYLIDVSSMFFRAYYAVRPLTSPSGVPVNAIYGFLSMITKLMKEEKPTSMVFCYDRKEPSFRKEMYPEYKANRSEMPEDLAQQIPYIKRLADLLGIPSLEVPLFEADDLIGTLTKYGRRHQMEVVIVSGDKDFGQLIEPGVVLYDTMKGVRYDDAGVFEKWGVRPDQFIDYLAIVGDTSDNIPGVKGIGEKGAIKLLEQFKTLEDIYENLDKISSASIRQKLIDAKEMALLSKKLVTISCDVPMVDDLEALRLQPFKKEELRSLFQELNFKIFEKTLLNESFATDPAAPLTAKVETPSPLSPQESLQILAHDLQEKEMSLSEVKNWLRPKLPVMGATDEHGVYLSQGEDVAVLRADFENLGDITDAAKIQWQGYDLKGLWHKIGAKSPIIHWDSQLAAYVLKAGDTSDFAKIYEREMVEVLPEDLTGTQLIGAQLRLQQLLEAKIIAQGYQKIFNDLDQPLAPILLAMENRGIRIDVDLLKKQSEGLAVEIGSLEKQIHELAGEEFNIGSPKQLAKILFEKLGLESSKKTKTGFSTGEDVLEKIVHPIGPLILQYRELTKLKSTYVDALPEAIQADGRLHTSFNQALAATGRLSSTKPNLQNIPIRTERGQQVRKAFIAGEGMKLLSVDYSQIELRVLAHISEDPNMIKAFADDLDIHAATAAEVFACSLENVTSEMRRVAKAVNFGIAYGQGVFGLSEALGIPRGEAQDIIKRYFERFQGIQAYIENTIRGAHETGFVETLSGRRRYIEELQAKNPALKKFGERAAINAPIQGTAADLVKKAMIEVAREVPLPMLLQVHDELIFEETEERLKEYVPDIVRIMEGVASLKVPLKVNYAMGDNWDEAH